MLSLTVPCLTVWHAPTFDLCTTQREKQCAQTVKSPGVTAAVRHVPAHTDTFVAAGSVEGARRKTLRSWNVLVAGNLLDPPGP
jgi:hypothetical protein